jgi:hypothetical protein
MTCIVAAVTTPACAKRDGNHHHTGIFFYKQTNQRRWPSLQIKTRTIAQPEGVYDGAGPGSTCTPGGIQRRGRAGSTSVHARSPTKASWNGASGDQNRCSSRHPQGWDELEARSERRLAWRTSHQFVQIITQLSRSVAIRMLDKQDRRRILRVMIVADAADEHLHHQTRQPHDRIPVPHSRCG